MYALELHNWYQAGAKKIALAVYPGNEFGGA
jgi:hypothetical protein